MWLWEILRSIPKRYAPRDHMLPLETRNCTWQVDSVRNISEYDDETQAGIQKVNNCSRFRTRFAKSQCCQVMFDQDQKRKGLPSSEELTQQDLLRKAWDAEGIHHLGITAQWVTFFLML